MPPASKLLRMRRKGNSATASIHELPRRLEAVEKPPRSSFWPLSRSVKSRFCSVLALDFRCFGAISDYRPVQRRLFQQAGFFSEITTRRNRVVADDDYAVLCSCVSWYRIRAQTRFWGDGRWTNVGRKDVGVFGRDQRHTVRGPGYTLIPLGPRLTHRYV